MKTRSNIGIIDVAVGCEFMHNAIFGIFTWKLHKYLMKSILFLICSLALFTVSASAQHTNIMISDQRYPNEPAIVLDPNNPDHIVAGANLNNFYFSVDGGYTWAEDTLYSTFGVWGDPVVIVDTNSSFYFFHLSAPSGYADPSWLDRIVCQKMDSIGQPWNNGSHTAVNGLTDHDKQWAVVDPRNNNIYMTWTQFDEYGSYNPADSSHILFSRSTDAGQTWTVPLRINQRGGDCVDEDNTVEGAVPAVGPNGEIYVGWVGPLGIMFDRSLDEGSTWLVDDIFVSDIPGGWDFMIPGIFRCNGLPVTCCDISSSPHRGNIYINWSDQRNGNTDTDVWLVKSTDGGNTWSAPKRVNDDVAGKQQFFTWMTVDQATGFLYFVFYDRRNYNDNRTDVYMAVSKDGGETFINFRISQSPFDPYSSVFFGDYTNITAYNDVVRPIWTRLDGEDLSIYTAIIDPVFLGNDHHQEIPGAELDQNYPNPFRESTFISFKLPASMPVNLKVYDMHGHEVARLIDHKMMPRGKYIKEFDAHNLQLASGVYYFSLECGDKPVVRKMIVNK